MSRETRKANGIDGNDVIRIDVLDSHGSPRIERKMAVSITLRMHPRQELKGH